MKPAPRKRRLITVQINLEELNSLPPLLRSRIIERAQRKSAAEQKQARFMNALDVEENP